MMHAIHYTYDVAHGITLYAVRLSRSSAIYVAILTGNSTPMRKYLFHICMSKLASLLYTIISNAQFQRKDREGLEILETDFATNLDDSIILALKSSNSVPLFLSEITLDLFGKQTYLG
jgi:hypothetical protein